jgi:hypothetical protein
MAWVGPRGPWRQRQRSRSAGRNNGECAFTPSSLLPAQSDSEAGPVDQEQTLGQVFGKLTYSGTRVHANGSVLATPTRVHGTLLAYNGTAPNATSVSAEGNASNLARGFSQDHTTASAEMNVFLASASYLSLRGGYFADSYADIGIPEQRTSRIRPRRSACPACRQRCDCQSAL